MTDSFSRSRTVGNGEARRVSQDSLTDVDWMLTIHSRRLRRLEAWVRERKATHPKEGCTMNPRAAVIETVYVTVSNDNLQEIAGAHLHEYHGI